jgi:heparin binding hemagglutinin HbhA
VTTTTPKKTEQKYSSAVYAAAGIGDMAVEQLRKIPVLADQLRERATQLREQGPSLRAQATELTGRVDVEKIRTALVTNAQKAAEKATSLYEDLVARGERAVAMEPAKPAKPAKRTALAGSATRPAAPAAKPAGRRPKAASQK